MKKLLLLFITLCLPTMLFAQGNYQPGYIITNQNDTVKGWINLRTDKNNQKQCEFKPDLNLPAKIYLPEDIASYRFTDEGKYYVSREIQLNGIPRKVFLEFLVKGIMNLYYYEDEADYYFFENQDGKMEAISQKPEREKDGAIRKDYSYVGKIRYLFQNYQPIAQRADKLRFDQKSMIGIVKEYHDEVCTSGESCIIFQNKRPDDKGLRYKFSVYTGLQLSNYSFNFYTFGNGNSQTESNVSPVLGAQLNLMNPRWSKSFSIQVDAALSQFKGDLPDGNHRMSETSYQALAISLRLGAKYTFYSTNKISPTAEAGIAYSYLKEQKRVNLLRHSIFGYYLGIGADYKIRTSNAIFIRLVYESYPFSDGTSPYGHDKINMLQAKLGYTF